VKLLLDTHVLLWFLQDDPRLSPIAKSIIENRTNQKLVSIATCWEISIKAGLKKLNIGEPASVFLIRELSANNFELLGVELAHALYVESLPHHHKDPFDRMLIAQALLETIPIVSADALFDSYGVTRLWN
jgi:PIN domain nuclease of toxin-antitoxin system